MPAVSLQKPAVQVTFLMPPGRPFGTGSATPPMKTLPVPADGTLTSQSLSVGTNEDTVDGTVRSSSVSREGRTRPGRRWCFGAHWPVLWREGRSWESQFMRQPLRGNAALGAGGEWREAA